MAKDKQADRKKAKGSKKAKRIDASPQAKATSSAARPTKVARVAERAKAKAADIATHPAVAEVVAATLVAAAAAIKNPQKARDMATAVGGELETASKETVDRGSKFWQLALDIARRSIDTLEAEKAGKRKSKQKKQSAK